MGLRASTLTVLVLIGTQLMPGIGRANEAYDFRVQVGANPPDEVTLPLEYTRFYPDHLRVHRGQTVQFDTLNFHTVAFRPGGEAGRLPVVRFLPPPPPSERIGLG